MSESSFLQRLKERKLVQWALAYSAGAWVLVEASNLVVERFHWPEVIGQAVIVIAFFGFFLTLILAWYHGEKGQQRVGGMELLLVTGLLVLTGLALSVLPGGEGSQPHAPNTITAADEGRPSIAVLPFQNLSGLEEDVYFTDGMHEELLTRLHKIGGLSVRGRTSVMEYRDTPKNLRQIGEELNARYLLEGGVQRAGGTVRINIQLIEASTDEHLWADTYDREMSLENLFSIQDEIVKTVTESVRAVVTPEERARLEALPTENQDAYDLYLRGWHYWTRPGGDQEMAANFAIAEEMWTRALEMDRDFALARARLSFLHGRMYFRGFDRSPDRLTAQAGEAEEALQLSPDLPEARFARGYVHYVRGELREALESYEVAQAGAPNDPMISYNIGLVYRRLGDWEPWEQAYLRTVELDPIDAYVYYDLGALTLCFLRRWEDAIAALDHALELAPDFTAANVRKALYLTWWRGDTGPIWAVLDSLTPATGAAYATWFAGWDRDADRLFQALEHLPVIDRQQAMIYPRQLAAAWGHQIRGDEQAALAAFDSAKAVLDSLLLEDPADFRVHGSLGYVYAGLGMKNEAAECARRYIDLSPFPEEDVFFRRRSLNFHEARILASAGLAESALDCLEELFSGPADLSIHDLRRMPIWDPIRDHPRFQALLERHAEDVER